MKSRFVIKPVSVKQVDEILEYISVIGGESDNLGFGVDLLFIRSSGL